MDAAPPDGLCGLLAAGQTYAEQRETTPAAEATALKPRAGLSSRGVLASHPASAGDARRTAPWGIQRGKVEAVGGGS
jgi:hypothetical protein